MRESQEHQHQGWPFLRCALRRELLCGEGQFRQLLLGQRHLQELFLARHDMVGTFIGVAGEQFPSCSICGTH